MIKDCLVFNLAAYHISPEAVWHSINWSLYLINQSSRVLTCTLIISKALWCAMCSTASLKAYSVALGDNGLAWKPPILTCLRPLKADQWALSAYKATNDCKGLKLKVICSFTSIHKFTEDFQVLYHTLFSLSHKEAHTYSQKAFPSSYTFTIKLLKTEKKYSSVTMKPQTDLI